MEPIVVCRGRRVVLQPQTLCATAPEVRASKERHTGAGDAAGRRAESPSAALRREPWRGTAGRARTFSFCHVFAAWSLSLCASTWVASTSRVPARRLGGLRGALGEIVRSAFSASANGLEAAVLHLVVRVSQRAGEQQQIPNTLELRHRNPGAADDALTLGWAWTNPHANARDRSMPSRRRSSPYSNSAA